MVWSDWTKQLRRRWALQRLREPEFSFMWDEPPEGEWVSLDCETTGLDRRSDEIISVAAVRIQGRRILTSQRLKLLVKPRYKAIAREAVRVHQLRELDVKQGLEPEDAMRELLRFIGSRPLVGYYLEFDVAMINRVIYPLLGVDLPQRKIEVSGLYYDLKNRQRSVLEQDASIDLRFDTLLADLKLPKWPAHDALNDAVMAALAFIKLHALNEADD